jgi:hypothetical protein
MSPLDCFRCIRSDGTASRYSSEGRDVILARHGSRRWSYLGPFAIVAISVIKNGLAVASKQPEIITRKERD